MKKDTRIEGYSPLFVLLATAVSGLIAYSSQINGSVPLADEIPYLCAFNAFVQDENPYRCARFFYPPAMAASGGWVLEKGSVEATLAGMRWFCLISAISLVVFSVQRLSASWPVRAAAGAALIAFGPGVREAMAVGNISPIAVVLSVFALSIWPRWPIAAGLLLGTGVSIKPIAAMAIPLLAVHGAIHRTRTAWVAGACAAVLAIVSWLPWLALLPDMLASVPAHEGAIHNISLQRIAGILKVPFPAYVAAACVGLGFCAYLSRRELSPSALLDVCIAACLLSLPVVWEHTFILAYPIVAAAVARMSDRLRSGALPRRRAVAEALWVGAAAIWSLQTDALGDLSEYLPPMASVVLLAAGVALPTVLAIYAGTERGKQGLIVDSG